MLDLPDKERLSRRLVATAEVIGDEVRPAAAALMVEDLSVYRMPVVEKALAACRRELKGRLSLAAILERIDDGHPTPNEAWAMAIPAADERNTVVWTGEMERAWAVAMPLIGAGDKIAARQAFLEAYARLVKDARAERRQADYRPSLGFDTAGREAALSAAVERGLLPAPPPVAMIEGPKRDMGTALADLGRMLKLDSDERRARDDAAAEDEARALRELRDRELAKLGEVQP